MKSHLEKYWRWGFQFILRDQGQNVGMEVEYLGLNWKQGKELIVKTEGEGQAPGEKVKV